MRLSVKLDGSVVIVIPHRFKEKKAEKFIKEKSDWVISKKELVKQFKGNTICRYTKKDYLRHKDRAHKLVGIRVDYFDKLYNFNYQKITIRNQKTRWGSCSKKGNLSFNYKIIFLPPRYLDYIIYHELCHLKEFNHSLKFWHLVETVFPDYKAIKKALKKYHLSLG